ncbi:MAG: cobyric acid synthase [Actinobacteria bacterium]|nr:cobyric acid synthase [Actinomycetota bacterium]
MEKQAKTIMIQGTGSHAGKSITVAALCRILKQDGYSVCPFKTQNMALNSFITSDGGEMGRAQVVQAEAAGLAPEVYMNPILLKPVADTDAQVIYMGKVVKNMSAAEYDEKKKYYVNEIKELINKLKRKFDVIVIEGAGSPAEINLLKNDVVNMKTAEIAQSPVILVGDIDKGGVFAHFYGTVKILPEKYRKYFKGMIINKFRGDKSLLDPGIKWIENKLKLPMVGVIPYYRDIFIEEEDSVNLEKQFSKQINSNSIANIKIAVLYLPHISNFTDFNALELEPGVDLLYVRKITELADFDPDVIIIPGSKSTINDLLYLRNSGIESEIQRRYSKGTIIFGVCGGYQMLGRKITDKYKTESKDFESIEGIGILGIETEFLNEKYTRQVDFSFNDKLSDFFKSCNFNLHYKFDVNFNMNGYEIHMGISKSNTKIWRSENIIKNKEFLTMSLFKIRSKTKIPERGTTNILNNYGCDYNNNYEDGVISVNPVKKNIAIGTYVHGIFDSFEVRKFLISLAKYVKNPGSGKTENKITIASERDNYFSYNELKEKQYDKLADLFRENMDMKMFYNILNNS